MKRLIVIALALLTWSEAKAEFPSKPITIVVPFGSGSGTDVITRVIAEPLGLALKQTVVIENKAG
jgi:tripartite-type tricarboxylate transporter receptor subunit TctC